MRDGLAVLAIEVQQLRIDAKPCAAHEKAQDEVVVLGDPQRCVVAVRIVRRSGCPDQRLQVAQRLSAAEQDIGVNIVGRSRPRKRMRRHCRAGMSQQRPQDFRQRSADRRRRCRRRHARPPRPDVPADRDASGRHCPSQRSIGLVRRRGTGCAPHRSRRWQGREAAARARPCWQSWRPDLRCRRWTRRRRQSLQCCAGSAPGRIAERLRCSGGRCSWP